MDLAVQAFCLREYGRQGTAITIHLSHGRSYKMPLPLLPSRAPAPPEWASGPVPKHLSDYQRVYWPGVGIVTFTPPQAKAVRLLWEAMEEGTHEVGQTALLAAAGSAAVKVSDLFKSCEKWRRLIVRGDGPRYRLAELPRESGPEEPRVVPDDD